METDFDLDLSGLSTDQKPAREEPFVMHSLLDSQKRHVELLSHLASYSELLVAVTGVDGAGKSFIANSLAAQREAPEETLLLTASVMLGMPSILSSIAGHWDMPAIHEDSARAREAIRNEALSRAEEGGNLLLIIDQADQLDAETLNDVAHFALLAPQAISVILFGTPGYETQFRDSPAQAPVHVLAIEPLTDVEISMLMAKVFGDGDVCPFSRKELSDLMTASGCLPGPALTQAEKILSSASRVATPAKTGFPLRNILAIAGVATVIMMILIYQWGAGSQVADSETGTEPSTIKDFNYPDDPAAVPSGEAAEVPTTELADRPVASVSSREAASADTNASVEDTSSDPQVDVSRQQAAAPEQQVTETIEAASSPGSASPAQADTSPALQSPSYTPDEQALLAPDSGYIVQLLGSYNPEGAERFRSEWRSQVTGTLYRYQTTHNGRDWHVVVSGVYSSRAEASAAVNALPESLRSQSPWIRPVGDVQQVIR